MIWVQRSWFKNCWIKWINKRLIPIRISKALCQKFTFSYWLAWSVGSGMIPNLYSFCGNRCLWPYFRNEIFPAHLPSFGKCFSKQLSFNRINKLRHILLIIESVIFFQCVEVTQKLSCSLWLLCDSLQIYRNNLCNYLYHRVTRRIHNLYRAFGRVSQR